MTLHGMSHLCGRESRGGRLLEFGNEFIGVHMSYDVELPAIAASHRADMTRFAITFGEHEMHRRRHDFGQSPSQQCCRRPTEKELAGAACLLDGQAETIQDEQGAMWLDGSRNVDGLALAGSKI